MNVSITMWKTYLLDFLAQNISSHFLIWVGETSFGMKIIVPCYPTTRTIQFGDCVNSSHILPQNLTCLYIERNHHWVCYIIGVIHKDKYNLFLYKLSMVCYNMKV